MIVETDQLKTYNTNMNLEFLREKRVEVAEIKTDDPARRAFWRQHQLVLTEMRDARRIDAAALRRSIYLQNPETGFLYRAGKKRKGWKMKQVEERDCLPEERGLGELLYRLYWKERKNSDVIAGEIGVATGSVINWLHRARIEVKDNPGFKDPIVRSSAEENRVFALRKLYSDPVKVAEIAAKIHTPQSDAQRAGSMSAWHKANPDKSREIAESAQLGLIKAADKRITDVLGDDPKSLLQRELLDTRISYAEFGLRYGLSLTQVIRAERIYLGVNREGPGLNSHRVAEAQEVEDYRELFGDRIVELLSPAQFEVLYLAYPIEGAPLKLREIIAKRGGTPQNAQSLIKIAIKKLRRAAKELEQ